MAKPRKPAKKAKQNDDDYDNELRGVLFKNKRKKAGRKADESKPDLTGSAEIEGVEYWVSAWFNVSKNGQKFVSLSFSVKEEEEEEEEENDEDFLPKKKSKSKLKAKGKKRAEEEEEEEEEEDDLPF